MKGEPMIAKELLEKVFTKSIHKSVIPNYQTDDHEKGKGHYNQWHIDEAPGGYSFYNKCNGEFSQKS